MFVTAINISKLVFTDYMNFLLIGSGIIIGLYYPKTMTKSNNPTELKIGKYVGYLYMGLGVLMSIVTRIF